METQNKWQIEFVSLENLSIGDLEDVLMPPGDDFQQYLVRQIGVAQRFATTDIRALPAVEIDNVLRQFRNAVIAHLMKSTLKNLPGG